MPVITKISVVKNDPHRFQMFLSDGDHEETSINISEESIINFQLHKGKELTELDLEEIIYFEEINQAMKRAIKFLSYRIRTEKEVRDDLEKKGFTDPIIQETISRLKSKNYINDKQFAESFVKTQMNTQDKGPEYIKIALKEKGIHLSLIDAALSLYSPEMQLEKAKKLCQKWLEKKSNKSLQQLKTSLQTMLLQKGFDRSIIQEAIDSIEWEAQENREEKALDVQGEKAWRKYQSLPLRERQIKVKQFLYRKGFPIEKIEKYVEMKLETEIVNGGEF